MALNVSTRTSSRSILLPAIPELFDPNFLDVLLPVTAPAPSAVESTAAINHSNPMMDALMATTRQTFSKNKAPAYSGTDSATLDAFSSLSKYTKWSQMEKYLDNAWKEDSDLTLRIIWNLRSIHDGKGEKEAFYRAFGWLYDNHPRTAISNLHMLVEPTCQSGKKRKFTSHGYWKDLLNILALATVDELSNISGPSTYLHAPRSPLRLKRVGHTERGARIQALVSKHTRGNRSEVRTNYEATQLRLVQKLSQNKFRALYIAVVRLFAEQLIKDIKVWHSVGDLGPGVDKVAFLKQLSLAAKWAPTPGGAHDRVTNISTALSELIYASQVMPVYPSILKTSQTAEDRAKTLRSFFQRWVLTELRRASYCIEPLMSANKWAEIKYYRVPSICMANNTDRFFKHDGDRFLEYLIAVEKGKTSISGATLMPHELVAKAIQLSGKSDDRPSKFPTVQNVRKELKEAEMRAVEAQWKSLISNLRESGSIENSLAICDVSGSMGNIKGKFRKNHVEPIFPAVALSLVLANLVKPPFNAGFITFSANPKFIKLGVANTLVKQVGLIMGSKWGMNTDLSAVFLKLLLPLAIRNKVKQEDMIKRLFIFSDMQFDAAQKKNSNAARWKTNYDVIQRAYKKAGYEVPQIVYWDLTASSKPTKEVQDSKREGVAMLNGFSPAMLKVFMEEGQEEVMEWEKIDESGDSVTVVEKVKEEFNPVTIMKKALMKKSFDGLRVVD